MHDDVAVPVVGDAAGDDVEVRVRRQHLRRAAAQRPLARCAPRGGGVSRARRGGHRHVVAVDLEVRELGGVGRLELLRGVL